MMKFDFKTNCQLTGQASSHIVIAPSAVPGFSFFQKRMPQWLAISVKFPNKDTDCCFSTVVASPGSSGQEPSLPLDCLSSSITEPELAMERLQGLLKSMTVHLQLKVQTLHHYYHYNVQYFTICIHIETASVLLILQHEILVLYSSSCKNYLACSGCTPCLNNIQHEIKYC